jgi:hypothetical protein
MIGQRNKTHVPGAEVTLPIAPIMDTCRTAGFAHVSFTAPPNLVH